MSLNSPLENTASFYYKLPLIILRKMDKNVKLAGLLGQNK